MKKWLLLTCLFAVFFAIVVVGIFYWRLNKEQEINKNAKVHVEKNGNNYSLIKNGNPFYIKGAGGDEYFKELHEIGANTVRIYDTLNLEQKLNEAQKYNLSVIVDLPVYRFTNTYNPYLNDSLTASLKESVKSIVQRYKDHPAILIWNLGNEIQYPTVITKNRIVESFDDVKNIFIELYNRRSFVKTFNDLIEIIHEEDPDHLVSTSLATNNFWRKVLSIHLFSPELDILGYNIFAPPASVRKYIDRLSHIIRLKPYYISEWGIEGPWAQIKTNWFAPIEDTSTRKGEQYIENHKLFADLYPESIGETSFFWGQKQERTHTWFSIFDKTGRKSQAFYSLQEIWTKEKDKNSWPPQIKYMTVEGKGANDNLIYSPDEIIQAHLQFKFNNDTALTYIWEIYPEEWNYAGGGIAHDEVNKVNVEFVSLNDSVVSFRTPAVEGPYRIYVQVNDDKGNFATANTPFYVLNPNK